MNGSEAYSRDRKVSFDIVVFDGVDELDVVGPLEVLRRAEAFGANARARLCGRGEAGQVTGSFGLRFDADAIFVPGEADVVIVPGGGWVARSEVGAWKEVRAGHWLTLLGEAAQAGSVMAGVCTGAMLLAHAGVIDDRRATTHKDAMEDLAALGVRVVNKRVVDEGKLVTAGGVTSGIDLALALVGRYFGPELATTLASGIEYEWCRDALLPADGGPAGNL
ncbi:MAG TPA: DJ-1/PfpI family protein [Acidimicrobiales bacterium]|nr:DJ-1/PfpI family protein [Acidimicrobiales bacterium]